MNKGDIIFGVEGTFRSFVNIEKTENTITNIHGLTLSQKNHNTGKGVFVKLMLDFYRTKNMLSAYAVGGNGGSLAIKYLNYLKFPKMPVTIEKSIIVLYHNPQAIYDASKCTLDNFLEYDSDFNSTAGIYELDKSMKCLQSKLEKAIVCISNDEFVDISF